MFFCAGQINTADEVQADAPKRGIDAVSAKFGKLLRLIGFDEKSPNKKCARKYQNRRAGELDDPLPYLRPDLQINTEREMNYGGK